ncbi:MAG: hypothetical protein Q7S46_00430, partial [Gallionella sp.]|nr:hypothetical protein [Gallionella sp.]
GVMSLTERDGYTSAAAAAPVSESAKIANSQLAKDDKRRCPERREHRDWAGAECASQPHRLFIFPD